MSQTEDNSSKKRSTTLGICLLLVTNALCIGNNYIVKSFHLKAGEAELVKGLIQSVVFVALIFIKNRKVAPNDAGTESLKNSKKSTWYEYLMILTYGFLHSTVCFSCVAALLLMPIGDLIVLCFTTPLFSVFLEAIFLKKPLTILSVFLCFLIVFGDVLVVQPDFIFKSTSTSISNETITESVLIEQKEKEPSYFIGVGLCLYAALAMSLANIIQVMVSRVSNKEESNTTNLLMLASGLWSILLSAILLPLLPNRLLTSPLSVTWVTGLILLLSSIVIIVAFWLMVVAVSITQNPTLVNMLRSTEIPMSFFTEAIYWSQFPDPLSIVGSLIVMLSVTLMSVNDKINSHWKKLKTDLKIIM